MPFPHPESGEDHDRNEDIAGFRRVLGEFVERTIDIAQDGNTKYEVNPTADCALRRLTDHVSSIRAVHLTLSLRRLKPTETLRSLRPESRPPTTSASSRRTVWRTRRAGVESQEVSCRRGRRCD